MNKLNRLTALLMALMMIFTTFASAESVYQPGSMTQDDWDALIQQTQDSLMTEEFGVALPVKSADNTNYSGTPDGKQYAGQTEANITETAAATLYKSGVLTLTGTDGRWQINVGGDIWVNIGNEQGTTLTVTEAMLNGASKVRQLHADGTSHEVTITVTEAPAAEPAMILSVQSKEAVPEEEITEEVQEQLTNPEGGAPMTVQDVNPTTFTVVINYVFTDGTQAASPYTGTVAAGSDLNTTVNSPTVLGYTPDQPSIVFNETNIQADITKTVIYSPALVTFTVKHYQQNLNDDNYAEPPVEETKTGYTESAVGETLAKEYEGFYALLYDTTTAIAADGSTVVEIYYDRYYYLMNFDLDGGYGVEPVYARYGTPIEVGTPTRAGYSFEKWQKGGVDATPPATMPAENQTYKAVWDPNDTATVTVVFWGENPNDEEYSYHHTGTVQVKPGTEFTFSESFEFFVCETEEHTHGSDCQLSCNHQTHTLDCYSLGSNQTNNRHLGELTTRPTQTLTDLGNGIYSYRSGWSTYYVVNIGDKWYSPMNTNNQVQTNSISLNCSHVHDASCWSCGKIEHTHEDSCYKTGAGMSSTLWTLVDSDTVTVAADGTSIINVYYDRTEFTLTFRANNNTVATITDKWGASISGEFAKAPFNTTYNGRAWECTDESKYNYALQTLDIMPQFDATFNLYGQSSYTEKTIYYYVQKVGTQTPTRWPSSHPDTANYDYLKEVDTYFNFITYNEEYHDIVGFTRFSASDAGFSDSSKGYDDDKVYLYYKRNSYQLDFYNYNAVMVGKEKTLQYQEGFQNYYVEPDYPEDLEPNAYEFEGWYSDQYFHNKVDWTTDTMPASDMMLYANWVPVTRTVNFYLTEALMESGTEADRCHPTQTVPHGTIMTSTPDEAAIVHPGNSEYEFIGWFYKDADGNDQAFNVTTPVFRDMELFAKWRTDVQVDYVIKYAVKNADGTLTYIAEDTTGTGLAETTKTFYAKTGEELDEGYQTGYYPETGSHSLTFDGVDLDNNTYTFIYVQKAKVPYTVYYVTNVKPDDGQEYEEVIFGTGDDAVVGYQLHAPFTEDTAEDDDNPTPAAIVTETFEPITGYMPDAYQKRLVLSANDEENVITFWYTKDDKHAPLHIVHYTQNIEGEAYTVYQESTDINALIDKEYSENPLTIPGFVYNEEKSTASGTMTAAGLELTLYYDRILYPYEFQFLEQSTNKVLAEPVIGNARYQAQVTQNFKSIEGYKLANASPQVIQIAIEDPADVASKNVRIFYYQEIDVTLNYEVVGPEGCGTVSPTSETVKAVTGTAFGSTATASSNAYKFVGWYLDEACTQPVPAENVDANNKFVPTKADGTLWVETTYYAKFEYNLTNLTITKAGSNETLDPNQSFIFTVRGGDLTAPLTVVIVNNGSVTISGLTVGVEYTVTEATGWSWRYTPEETQNGEKTITLQPSSNTLTFTNTRDGIYWLDGNATSGPNDFN